MRQQAGLHGRLIEEGVIEFDMPRAFGQNHPRTSGAMN
jgi:hypothetical protein